MSLTPVMRNFASVTRSVFRDHVVFSCGAPSRFASSKYFRIGDSKTQRHENVRVCPALFMRLYAVSPTDVGPGLCGSQALEEALHDKVVPLGKFHKFPDTVLFIITIYLFSLWYFIYKYETCVFGNFGKISIIINKNQFFHFFIKLIRQHNLKQHKLYYSQILEP